MNAQRIPTQAENAAMVRRSRNHTIRQQRGLERYVEIQADAPEPVNFCAVPVPGEDGEPQVWAWVGSTPALVMVILACAAWAAYFWSAQ